MAVNIELQNALIVVVQLYIHTIHCATGQALRVPYIYILILYMFAFSATSNVNADRPDNIYQIVK